jgi:hypothetical protein
MTLSSVAKDSAKKKEDGAWQWEGLIHPTELTTTEQVWNDASTKGNIKF